MDANDAASYVQELTGEEANIIFGAMYDDTVCLLYTSNLVDADGNLIDWDGNRIDENGYLLDANGDHILDEEGLSLIHI